MASGKRGVSAKCTLPCTQGSCENPHRDIGERPDGPSSPVANIHEMNDRVDGGVDLGGGVGKGGEEGGIRRREEK